MSKRLKCPNCFHEWEYKGKAKENQFVTCPKCHYQRHLKNYEEVEVKGIPPNGTPG